MAFREKIELVVDIVTGSTNTQLRRLRTELDDADGAFNKLKVAGSGAFDAIKANAGALALGAGAAIAAFGAKAISEFQDTALEAGRLSDALGITTEEASRLNEVAGDLGIGAGAVETALGRMNRTAQASPEHFDAIGASIKRNADGTLDVVGTFENAAEAIDKIPDAGRRAEAAQKIFGRGWQDVAELIRSGADGIRDSMAEVENAKVIDEQEVARARKFRDAMDELKGVFESVTIEIGGRLVPALTTAAEAATKVEEAWKRLDDIVPDWADPIINAAEDVLNPVQFAVESLDRLNDAFGPDIQVTIRDTSQELDEFDGAADRAATRVEQLGGTLDDEEDSARAAADAHKRLTEETIATEDAARRLERQWGYLNATLSNQSAYLSLQDSFDDVRQKGIEAYAAAESGAGDAEQKARDYERAVADLGLEVSDYSREVLGIPAQQATDIIAKIQRGQLDDALADINELNGRVVTVSVRGNLDGLNAQLRAANGSTISVRGVASARAKGGPVRAGDPYVVGEDGPELMVPNQSGTIVPNSAISGGSSLGGNSYTINVNAGGLAANGNDIGRQVVDAIKKYERFNGTAWRS